MKSLLLLAGLSAAAVAWGGEIDNIQALSQQQFRLLSEDLGGALSYRPQTPTEPLGITGFDIGLAATGAKIANVAVLDAASSGSVDATLPIPTLRLYKGLPFGIDFGLMYAAIADSNMEYVGGELRWAFIQGGAAMPAVGVRGSITQLRGVDQLDLETRGLDLSISKGFALVTPYAGLGRVWVKSDPKGNGGLRSEEFELDKLFIGLGMKFVLFNLNFEADKTGDVEALSLKAGLRF